MLNMQRLINTKFQLAIQRLANPAQSNLLTEAQGMAALKDMALSVVQMLLTSVNIDSASAGLGCQVGASFKTNVA